MGRLDGASQALAIGLLNMADDDGYFLGDPAAVRSALRPFDDDSTIVRRALDELSRAGWVTFKTHPEMGLIGFVANFAAHQRIDRHTPSKLKKYWDLGLDESSTSVRRVLDDRSLLEWKGMEGKGTGKGVEAPPPQEVERAPAVFVEPTTDPDTWLAEDFFAWAQSRRQKAGLVGERRRPRNLAGWWSTCLMTPGVTAERMQGAFLAFGDSKHWQAAQPPLPFQGFMAQWDQFVPREVSRAS